MEKRATFSFGRMYRYTLWRYWGGPVLIQNISSGYAMFIVLNPSTADENNDDPTVRRCIGYAKEWGYNGLCMMNLFAFQTRYPKVMKAARDPVGPDNNKALMDIAEYAEVIIAAWGVPGSYLDRDQEVYDMLPQLHYLRLTKGGFPGHPLFLPKGLKPILWNINAKGK